MWDIATRDHFDRLRSSFLWGIAIVPVALWWRAVKRAYRQRTDVPQAPSRDVSDTRRRIVIDVARDFSEHPWGRTSADGPFSGARFRSEFLVPALDTPDAVTVVRFADMPVPYSWLEEVFAPLQEKGFDREFLEDRLVIESKSHVVWPPFIWQEIIA